MKFYKNVKQMPVKKQKIFVETPFALATFNAETRKH